MRGVAVRWWKVRGEIIEWSKPVLASLSHPDVLVDLELELVLDRPHLAGWRVRWSVGKVKR